MYLKRINVQNYFFVPNQGLMAYFNRVKVGNDEEYRTTFAKGHSLQKVLDDWDSVLSTICNRYPGLYNYETDMKGKVGPMSIMLPLKDRMGDVESYYSVPKNRDVPFEASILDEAASRLFGKSKLHLRSKMETLDKMKLSTNSGCPYFTKRNKVITPTINSQLYSSGHVKYFNTYHDLRGTKSLCAILGWRGQEGGPEPDDVKQRVVWMFPFSVNLEELRCYQPVIELCQSLNTVPPWVSMEAVDLEITRLIDSVEPGDVVMCTDFTKFDQHFRKSMQDCAHGILERVFYHDNDMRIWLSGVFPIKYNIPLMVQPDTVVEGYHGMGSGSGGTNVDETLAHTALQLEAAKSVGAKLNPHSMCLGDDGILSFHKLDPERVMASYVSHGLEMNADKQTIHHDECTFLRRWHSRNYRVDGVCVGVYSTMRALGRLCEQERFYNPKFWGPKMVALRQLSILENCKYHPLRDEFVVFCMKRDAYRLGLDIPGFFDDISAISEEAIANIPDFLGYTKSQQLTSSHGIADWWIVKHLKSLKPSEMVL